MVLVVKIDRQSWVSKISLLITQPSLESEKLYDSIVTIPCSITVVLVELLIPLVKKII